MFLPVIVNASFCAGITAVYSRAPRRNEIPAVSTGQLLNQLSRIYTA